jgi:hypothetical protein
VSGGEQIFIFSRVDDSFQEELQAARSRAVRLNPEGASLGARFSRAQLECVLMWNGGGEPPDIFTEC